MFSKTLGIRPGVTAVIGGGGKSTLLRRLGEELSREGSVLLCTTTKINPFSGISIACTAGEIREFDGRLLCAGTPIEGGKLTVPEIPMAELAERFSYVLVEADGSAGRPLKAHAAHEPVIPPEAERTILVLGASGFGQPICAAAHRPERYAALAAAALSDPVTPAMAARVLQGENLHTDLLINQIETSEAYAAAMDLAALVSGPVFGGSLQKGEIFLCSL